MIAVAPVASVPSDTGAGGGQVAVEGETLVSVAGRHDRHLDRRHAGRRPISGLHDGELDIGDVADLQADGDGVVLLDGGQESAGRDHRLVGQGVQPGRPRNQ